VENLNEKPLGRPSLGWYDISKWILNKQDEYINLADDEDK
jgi:hypothetical protein